MTRKLCNRRDFIRVGAGVAALTFAAPRESMGAMIPDMARTSSNSPAGHKRGTETEMAIAADWAQAFAMPSSGARTTSGTTLLPGVMMPPFSFRYGGRESTDLIPSWKSEVKTADLDGGRRQQEVTYSDPVTHLKVRAVAVIFKDFPAVEWVMYFKNGGRVDTPILQNILPLDAQLRSSEGDPIIHYARGATCSMNDFMPMTRTLSERGRLHLQPGGGRSSSEYLPFFNIEAKGEGAVVAVGWSGEWAATFHHPDKHAEFRAQAGMALTHLILHPGEEVRTPRILTLFWQGHRRRGNNLLRQFILAHHRPSPGGRPLFAPITNHNWGGTPAADHLGNIRQIIAHDLPMDYYWIDAEWFGNGPWWKNPGNWEVKRDLYPQGFKPISDLLHSAGRKFLLWFEPERVCEGTPWYTEHSNWLLDVPRDKRVYRGFAGGGDWDLPMSDPRWVPNESTRNQIQENDKLFNLAIPEARNFLTDFISSRIDEFGLDCFRNDANIAPLEFWRAADARDRQGITEIRWIEGFYAFWDELLRRHPNLIIDDCASGGRRIDLETIGRSTALSRTDFVGNPVADQCHTLGLLEWVPLNSTIGPRLSVNNEYVLRSSMAAGLSYGLFAAGDVPQSRPDYGTFPFVEVRKSLEQYRSIQKYFYGDYYPLTEYSQTNDAWVAYQLDLPEEGEGLVVVLKRPQSGYTHAVFGLHALIRGATYEISNLDTSESLIMDGEGLVGGGLEVILLKKPDSGLFRYRIKG
jgi:alpha-galactosidase